MNLNLLGGLTPRAFLRRHWHKKPLLIRSAIENFRNLLSLRQLIAFARHDMCESRLIIGSGNRQEVIYGPLPASLFRDLPEENWTVLVQGINHVVPRARELLARFSFLPQARLDDVMVSYAAPGGGVGPHFDSYDVFLLQGQGRRQWAVSAQSDLELVPDTELKILRRFRPQGRCVAEAGDMLYLPPKFAHDGVALDPCFTYSIGFRAPSHEELKTQFLAFLDDELHLPGRYADPDLSPCPRFGEIDNKMIRRVTNSLSKIRWTRSDITRFLGRYLSEPKSHIVLHRPPPIDLRSFAHRARAQGMEVHPALPLLFHGRFAFINGAVFEPTQAEWPTVRALSDSRFLPGFLFPAHVRALRILHNWYGDGYLSLGKWGRP